MRIRAGHDADVGPQLRFQFQIGSLQFLVQLFRFPAFELFLQSSAFGLVDLLLGNELLILPFLFPTMGQIHPEKHQRYHDGGQSAQTQPTGGLFLFAVLVVRIDAQPVAHADMHSAFADGNGA